MSIWDEAYAGAFPAGTERLRVSAGDLDVEAVSLGSGEPPLLLLHGYTGSALDWVDVIGPLAAARRVIAYDHRGHGGSGHAAGGEAAYTFDALLGDLESVVDTLGLARFHLLGHSMGGVIAMRYALAHRDRLASLVLMDTAASSQGGMPIEAIEGLAVVGRADGMTAVADVVQGMLPAATEQAGRRGRATLGAMDVDAFVGFARELDRYPSMLEALGSLRVPTTIVCGTDDPLIVACEQLAATIPSAVLERVEAAGHSPQQDQPEAWLAALTRHLTRLDRM